MCVCLKNRKPKISPLSERNHVASATSSWDRPIAKVVAVAKIASSWSNKTHTESNATDGGWPSAAATDSSASAIAPSAAATDSSASAIAPAASAASSAGPDQDDAAQTNAMADDSVIGSDSYGQLWSLFVVGIVAFSPTLWVSVFSRFCHGRLTLCTGPALCLTVLEQS